jgi:glycosyltransferase involved in cell wall biosynthesis
MSLATCRPSDPPPLGGRPRPGLASIGLLSTYPPTQCGLATFTAALLEQLNVPAGQAGVVRVVDEVSAHPGAEVVSHLVNGSPASALDAAETLNDFDVVVLQHEYGIYGGPDGVDVLALVDELTVPLIVVLHTVLEDPTASQRRILLHLLRAADVVVTMTRTASRRLVDSYAADPTKVLVIPHGSVDHRRHAVPAPASDRPTILTWGLLGPGKGIEWAIEAMPGLRDLRPRYLVLGKTHPKVLEHSGESYRDGLRRRVKELGVEDLVELDGTYLDVGSLSGIVASADVVLLPYDSRDQVTSGVLIEAVAAGRPVVSTAFPHAVELLADGAGLVVPQRDPAAIEQALRRVLSEPGRAQSMSARAAAKAPSLFWPAVGSEYRRLAQGLKTAAMTEAS